MKSHGSVVVEYLDNSINVYQRQGKDVSSKLFAVPRRLSVDPDGQVVYGVKTPTAGRTLVLLNPDCTSQRCLKAKHRGSCPVAHLNVKLSVGDIERGLFRVVCERGQAASAAWHDQAAELRYPGAWSSIDVARVATFAREAGLVLKYQPAAVPVNVVDRPAKRRSAASSRQRLLGPEAYSSKEQRSTWWVPEYGTGGK